MSIEGSARPGGTAHVPRERVLRIVAAADPAILLVVAPAGWGKSSLLADWVAARDGAVLWLPLGPRHADTDAFLAAVARCAARATRTDEAAWLERAMPDGRPAAARLRTLLASVNAPIAIALDDVHTLPAGSPADALLDEIVDRARAGEAHVALASRTPIPSVRARDIVHGRALRLDAHVLAMDAQEIAAFFHDSPRGHDAEFLAAAARRTRGWPAGLRMLRHRAARDDHGTAAVDAGEDEIGAYFDEEILAPLAPHLREALSDLALLERIEGPAAHALGADDAFEHAQTLARDGLFVAPGEDGLLLHPMLRDHLRDRAFTRDPGRVAARLARLAHWHARHGRSRECLSVVLEALAAARVAGPATLREIGAFAAGCLESAAPALVESARRDVILSVADAIPADSLRARPYLARLLLWLRAGDDAECADVPADGAARCMHHVLQATRAFRAARHAEAGEAALEARAVAPADDPFLRNLVVSLLQGTFRFTGDARLGQAAVAEAAHLAEDLRRPVATVQAGAMHGILLIMHGRLHAAGEALRRALAIADARLDPGAPARALAHQFLGYVLYEWDRIDEAAGHLERARSIAEPLGHRGILTGVLRVLAIVRLRQGNVAAARAAMEALEQRVDVPETDARNREWLDGVRAAFAVAAGDAAALPGWIARQGYDPAAVAALPGAQLHARLQEYTTLAHALILLGRFQEAVELATAIRSAAHAADRRGFLVVAAAARAAAHEALGNRTEADRSLTEALAAAAPEMMVRALTDTPGPIDAVLARVRPDGIPATFLEAVRRRTGGGTLPAGLTDRERDVLILLADGRSNKALARALGVSLSTVKTHLNHAFRKLDAHSRTHALARARALGVIGDAAWSADGDSPA